MLNLEFPHRNEEEKKHRGFNVLIRNRWQRHAQKQSGEVFNADKNGVSNSAISQAGAEKAYAQGSMIMGSDRATKGYRSSSARTFETFEALRKGYQETNEVAPVKEKVRIREELEPARGPREWLAEYEQKWTENKKRFLEQGISSGKYPNIEFSKLSPDQQEEIAEAAEEPVIQEWLDNPESSMAKKFPPFIQASRFAKLFNDRGARMAAKLYDNSEVDLFHITHKTATEAFLASGVLVDAKNGKHIKKIADIGGSLKILDKWESVVKTNDAGEPIVYIYVRGKEYQIDRKIFSELLNSNES